MHQNSINNFVFSSNRLLLLLCAVLALAEVFAGLHLDFEVYFLAVTNYFEGGWLKVYDPKAMTPFKYHPFTIWFFAPLRLFTWQGGIVLWGVLNAYFTYDSARRFQHFFKAADWMPVVAMLCVAHAWTWQIKFGNITCMMLWFFTLFATNPGIREKAGSAALLMVLKPFWAVLLPLLLWGKAWKTLGYAMLFLILACISIFFLGFDQGKMAYELWKQTLADPTNAHNYLKNDNQCAFASCYSLQSILGQKSTWLWVLISGVYFGHALWTSGSNFTLRALAILPPMLFIGPLSWIHHQILLIPVFIFLLSRRQFWIVGIAAFCFTGTSEAFMGRDFFVDIHQSRIPALGFLVLSLGLYQAQISSSEDTK